MVSHQPLKRHGGIKPPVGEGDLPTWNSLAQSDLCSPTPGSLGLVGDLYPMMTLENLLFHLRAIGVYSSQEEPPSHSEILPFLPFHI